MVAGRIVVGPGESYAGVSNMTSSHCIAEMPLAAAAKASEVPPVRRRSAGHQILSLVAVMVLSLVAYYFISRFVLMTVVVQGRSMSPTLLDGQHLMLNRMAFLIDSPRHGDLVVLKDPGHSDYAVKRVVGVPGDTLLFDDGAVFRNGRKLCEVYLGTGMPTLTPNLKKKCVALGAGEYFVLGDNRGNSEDSRFYGPISGAAILGLVWR
jgi:signal peptidase I